MNSSAATAPADSHRPPPKSAWIFLFLAWLVAVGATLGALFIGEVLGQQPCILCWYQRIFMFPLAIVLGLAAFRDDLSVRVYALPLALIGGAVALYHALLYAGVLAEAIQPCGKGPSCTDSAMTLFGIVPLPFLSLAAFLCVALLLILSSIRFSR